MLTILEQKIKIHNEQIQKSNKPYSKKCPRCNSKARYFQKHSIRKRKFLLQIENIVKEVLGILARWKCSECSRTFTDYPSFCMRYKHYVKDSLIDKCQEYVENDRASYEKLSKFVGYESEDAIDERKLAKSTIWRWCGNLGNKEDLCESLLKLLLQIEPGLKMHEKFFPVAKHKYRSVKRKMCLEILQRICAVILFLKRFLKQEIFFTDFETW